MPDVEKASNFLVFLIKLAVGFLLILIFSSLLGYYGVIIVITIFVIFFVVNDHFSYRRMRREQVAFMKKRAKKRFVSFDTGRWGEFVYVYMFGVYFAADSKKPDDMRGLVKDLTIVIRSVEDDGSLPRGKLYSEVTADMVKTFGVDSDFIRWKCATEMINDIQFLRKIGFTCEPTTIEDWVKALTILARNDGRTVYHPSFIVRVINSIEKKAEMLQADAMKAGGIANG